MHFLFEQLPQLPEPAEQALKACVRRELSRAQQLISTNPGLLSLPSLLLDATETHFGRVQENALVIALLDANASEEALLALQLTQAHCAPAHHFRNGDASIKSVTYEWMLEEDKRTALEALLHCILRQFPDERHKVYRAFSIVCQQQTASSRQHELTDWCVQAIQHATADLPTPRRRQYCAEACCLLNNMPAASRVFEQFQCAFQPPLNFDDLDDSARTAIFCRPQSRQLQQPTEHWAVGWSRMSLARFFDMTQAYELAATDDFAVLQHLCFMPTFETFRKIVDFHGKPAFDTLTIPALLFYLDASEPVMQWLERSLQAYSSAPVILSAAVLLNETPRHTARTEPLFRALAFDRNVASAEWLLYSAAIPLISQPVATQTYWKLLLESVSAQPQERRQWLVQAATWLRTELLAAKCKLAPDAATVKQLLSRGSEDLLTYLAEKHQIVIDETTSLRQYGEQLCSKVRIKDSQSVQRYMQSVHLSTAPKFLQHVFNGAVRVGNIELADQALSRALEVGHTVDILAANCRELKRACRAVRTLPAVKMFFTTWLTPSQIRELARSNVDIRQYLGKSVTHAEFAFNFFYGMTKAEAQTRFGKAITLIDALQRLPNRCCLELLAVLRQFNISATEWPDCLQNLALCRAAEVGMIQSEDALRQLQAASMTRHGKRRLL